MRYALPLLCLLASPAMAAGKIIVSPIYSQLVAMAVPDEFVAGDEVDKDGFYTLDLAPKGETLDAWTQLITLTGAKDEAPLKSVVDIAAELGVSYKQTCPATFSARTLPPPKVRGASEVFSGYLGCGNAKGQSEAMVFLVLKGANEIYTAQWAEHGAAQSKAMKPDPVIWRPRADDLALTRICDKVAGEQAPYPSCTQ